MRQRDITAEELESLIDDDNAEFILWIGKEFCRKCEEFEEAVEGLEEEGEVLRIKLLFTQSRLLREIRQILGIDIRGFPAVGHIKGGDVIGGFYGNKIEEFRKLLIEINLTSG